MLNLPGKNFSFLMRLRIVTDADGQSVLRGSLLQIGAANVHYFVSLDAIARIVQDLLADAQTDGGQAGAPSDPPAPLQ